MQCITGERGTERDYKKLAQNPVETCRLWRRENTKSIVFTDLDSFECDDNSINLRTILEVAKSVDIPVNFFSDFKDTATCRMVLENGVYRIIIEELALIDPDGTRKLIADYTPSRIMFNIFARNRIVDFASYGSRMTDVEFGLYLKGLGANRLVYTDYAWLDYTKEFCAETLIDLAERTKMRITLAGGVMNSQQLWRVNELNRYGIDSVIISKPLYENNFPCQKIWRLVEAQSEFGNH